VTENGVYMFFLGWNFVPDLNCTLKSKKNLFKNRFKTLTN